MTEAEKKGVDAIREAARENELRGAELLRELILEKKKKEVEMLKRELGIDNEEMVALMEGTGKKDDTDYITGRDEPRAHINACGTGELTVFIDPSKVTTLTLIGNETRHYDLAEKGAGFDEARYSRVCQLLEEAASLMSEWGCVG